MAPNKPTRRGMREMITDLEAQLAAAEERAEDLLSNYDATVTGLSEAHDTLAEWQHVAQSAVARARVAEERAEKAGSALRENAL